MITTGMLVLHGNIIPPPYDLELTEEGLLWVNDLLAGPYYEDLSESLTPPIDAEVAAALEELRLRARHEIFLHYRLTSDWELAVDRFADVYRQSELVARVELNDDLDVYYTFWSVPATYVLSSFRARLDQPSGGPQTTTTPRESHSEYQMRAIRSALTRGRTVLVGTNYTRVIPDGASAAALEDIAAIQRGELSPDDASFEVAPSPRHDILHPRRLTPRQQGR